MAIFNGSANDIENATENKVSTIIGNEDAKKYPTCQAVKNFVNKKFQLIEEISITQSDVAKVDRNKTPEGSSYNFEKIYIVFTNGGTSNVNVNISIYDGSAPVVFAQTSVVSGGIFALNPIYQNGMVVNACSYGERALLKPLNTRIEPTFYNNLTRIVVGSSSLLPVGSKIQIYGV